MRSIRTFAYAAALALSMFTIQPTLAAAEDAHGSFTLSSEVHWQNSVLPAGNYTFFIKSNGATEFLIITRTQRNGHGRDASGERRGVTEAERSQPIGNGVERRAEFCELHGAPGAFHQLALCRAVRRRFEVSRP